ncbi:MAG: heavy-metal-associated domain-containing protein [Pseudonocardia sp.]
MSVETPFRTQVTVAGMTCNHCVMSVTEEVSEIEGVRSVEVELASGLVTVVGSRDVARDEIAAAVATAGFTLSD